MRLCRQTRSNCAWAWGRIEGEAGLGTQAYSLTCSCSSKGRCIFHRTNPHKGNHSEIARLSRAAFTENHCHANVAGTQVHYHALCCFLYVRDGPTDPLLGPSYCPVLYLFLPFLPTSTLDQIPFRLCSLKVGPHLFSSYSSAFTKLLSPQKPVGIDRCFLEIILNASSLRYIIKSFN